MLFRSTGAVGPVPGSVDWPRPWLRRRWELRGRDELGGTRALITEGAALAQAGEPRAIGGLRRERLVPAPEEGVFTTTRRIGGAVQVGDVVGRLGPANLNAPTSGMLHGLVRDTG